MDGLFLYLAIDKLVTAHHLSLVSHAYFEGMPVQSCLELLSQDLTSLIEETRQMHQQMKTMDLPTLEQAQRCCVEIQTLGRRLEPMVRSLRGVGDLSGIVAITQIREQLAEGEDFLLQAVQGRSQVMGPEPWREEEPTQLKHWRSDDAG